MVALIGCLLSMFCGCCGVALVVGLDWRRCVLDFVFGYGFWLWCIVVFRDCGLAFIVVWGLGFTCSSCGIADLDMIVVDSVAGFLVCVWDLLGWVF